MATFLIDGHPSLDRVEAETWAEAEAMIAGKGEVIGERVDFAAKSAFGLTEIKFVDEAKTDEYLGSFEGYGAVFNNVDRGGDKILPGAFTETLAEWKAGGRLPTMFYEHGQRGGGPSFPAGVYTSMIEDGHGLRVAGKLINNSVGRDVYPTLKAGGIGGLSIGYRVKEVGRPAMGAEERRQIKTAALYEVSLVNDPMNLAARFTSVKSADDLKNEIKTLSELGHLLREAMGWSRSQTEAVMSNFQAKSAQGEPDKEAAAIAALLRRNLLILSK